MDTRERKIILIMWAIINIVMTALSVPSFQYILFTPYGEIIMWNGLPALGTVMLWFAWFIFAL